MSPPSNENCKKGCSRLSSPAHYPLLFLVALISCYTIFSQTPDIQDIPRNERVDLAAIALIPSPAFPVLGERVRIELRVTNSSDNPARAVPVILLAGTARAGSTTLNIQPRQTVSTFFDWTAGPEGLQLLTAIVDPEHHFVEESYADNVAAADVVVATEASKSADLSVSNLVFVTENARSLLRATVTNYGKAPLSAPMVFKADDRAIGVLYIGPIPAGQNTIVEVDYPDISPPSRIAAEVNPRFRSSAKHATVLTNELAPSVDLRVEGLSVHASEFEVERGRFITLSFRVVNAGTKPVLKPFRTSIFPGVVKSGRLESDSVLIQKLAAGDAVYISRTVDSPSDKFDIRVEADADQVIADGNRANNVATYRYKNPIPDVDRWINIGPRRINDGGMGAVGVLFGIVVDPQSPSTIYVSAPKSGVWKTTDGGAHWQAITDALPSLLVSALALDPSNPSTVYVATSDFGIFVSDDGGGTWRVLDPPGTANLNPPISAIETLVVDPSNPNLLLMTSPDGLYVHDRTAANKWKLVLSQGPGADLIADAAHPGTFFATLMNSGIGIFRSLDSGQNWLKLGGCPGQALPSTDGVTRITLGLSGGILYAAFKSADKFEVFRTKPGISCSIGGQQEDQWEKRFTLTDPNAVAILWNRINVDPTDPKFVYISGTQFQVSTNGASSFSINSGPQPHVDHHGFATDPNDPKIIYVACDGGIYRSSNRGANNSWQFIGNGIFNVQFYDSALAVTDQTMVTGGTQDNGTLEFSGSTNWDEINGGDGGTVAIDPTNSQIKYSMNQGPESMQKRVGNGNWACISCGDLALLDDCFNLAFQVHPRTPAILLAPCQSLWQATSPVCTRCPSRRKCPDPDPANCSPGSPLAWQVILPKTSVTGNVVRSAVDPTLNLYYAGTSAGELWAGPGGANWRLIFTGSGSISDIEVDLDDPATVYVSVARSGTGRVFRLRRSTTSPTQATVTATDITVNLPQNLTVNSLAVDRMNPFTIYAATNRGVYNGRSIDRGGTWRWGSYMNGLPLADVRDLEVHQVTGVMLAATFGRSAYEVNTGPPLGSLLSATGKVTFLRVNELGTGFGPPTDFLNAEAIVLLDSQPGKGFGFTLRNDADNADHLGMLDVLRSAFTRNRTVKLDYIRTGLRNGKIIRVETVN